jgi:Tfp pilus assembly protein PilF
LYLVQNKLDAARERFEQIARRDSKAIGAETLIAIILEMQGKTQDARTRYEAILTREPSAAVAANNLAWLYAEQNGDLAQALRFARTARQFLPEEPQVSDTLGWIYYKQQLPGLAVPELLRSVEKNPANPVYQYHLGLARLAAGDTEKGRESLQRALKLQPNFPGAEDARAALARASS